MNIETLLHRYETALNSNDIETILSLYGSEWKIHRYLFSTNQPRA